MLIQKHTCITCTQCTNARVEKGNKFVSFQTNILKFNTIMYILYSIDPLANIHFCWLTPYILRFLT
jgi:hypothetical protein